MRRPSLTDALGTLVIFFLCAFGPSMAGDPGLGWHLEAGRIMLETKQILTVDPFLFAPENSRWIHDQWLGDCILAFIFQWGGLPLLHWFSATLAAGTYFFILSRTLRAHSVLGLAAFLILALGAVVGGIQWITRPVLFSFFLFACVLHILLKKDWSKTFQGVVLFFLFALWSNLHPGFLFGILVVGIYSASLVLERSAGFVAALLLFLAAFLGSLLNPYTYELYLGAISLLGSSFFMSLNREWLPADFSRLPYFPFLLSIVCFSIIVIASLRKKRLCFPLLLFIVFLVLGLQRRRYIPFWSPAALAAVAVFLPTLNLNRLPFAEVSKELRSYDQNSSVACWSLLMTALIGIWCLVFGSLPFRSIDQPKLPTHLPIALTETLLTLRQQERIPAQAFNHPDWGGYLTWEAQGRMKFFIDDRNQVSSEEKYKDFFKINQAESDWEEIVRKYDIRLLILEAASPLNAVLAHRPEWIALYKTPDSESAEARGSIFLLAN